jgi:CBS domain-containing protein
VHSDNPVVKDHIITLGRYPHLKEHQSLSDAVEVIKSYTAGSAERLRYSGMLIVDDNNRLVGRVTMQDIVLGIDPRFTGLAKVNKYEGKKADVTNLVTLWEDSFFEECSKRGTKKIIDFMSPIKHTVKGDDSLLKALAVMLSDNETVLPVVEDDLVVGVLRLEEIFKAITSRCKL